MKKVFRAFLWLSVWTLSFSLVHAADSVRVIEDQGNVPELVATYGDGIVGSSVNWASNTVLAVGGTLGVWLYDITSLDSNPLSVELPRHLLKHDGGVRDVQFNVDRSRMVSAAWGTVRAWDMATESMIAEVPGWDAVALSADGRFLIAGSGQGSINIWDLDGDTTKPLTTLVLSEHEARVGDIQFSADGRVLAASAVTLDPCTTDSVTVIQTWDFAALLETGSANAQLNLTALQDDALFALSLDGQSLAYPPGGLAPGLRVVDSRTGDMKVEFLEQGELVSGLFYASDGRLILQRKRWRDWWSFMPVVGLELLKEADNVLANAGILLSPDGERFAYADTRTVYLYDLTPLSLITRIEDDFVVPGRDLLNAPVFTVAAADKESVLQRLAAYDDALDLSADGSTRVRQLSGTEANDFETIFTFENLSGERLSSVTVEAPFYLNASLLSADGIFFAVLLNNGALLDDPAMLANRNGCGDGTEKLQVWDTHTGALTVEMNLVYQGMNGLAFAPDDRLLAVSNGGRIKLLRPHNGELVADWHAHSSNIGPLAFTGDGELLLSASSDGTIRAWDIAD